MYNKNYWTVTRLVGISQLTTVSVDVTVSTFSQKRYMFQILPSFNYVCFFIQHLVWVEFFKGRKHLFKACGALLKSYRSVGLR